MSNTTRQGTIFAVSAYLIWGVTPAYFKLIEEFPPFQIVGHRILWALPVLFLLICFTGQFSTLKQSLGDKKLLLRLFSCGLLIGINWGIFIWSVSVDKMSEASLGYFINPLINVLIGYVLLGERLRPLQTTAVIIATIGVLYLIVVHGYFPWIGLSLAISFAIYGVIKKRLQLNPFIGLFLEALVLLPLSLLYFYYVFESNQLYTDTTSGLWMIIPLAGILTIIPLYCFAKAAPLISFSSLGFFQYIAPSLTLFLAVFVYGEPFGEVQAIGFGCIWFALGIFSIDLIKQSRKRTAFLPAQ